MKPTTEGAVDAFNRDVVANDGYLYTTNARLSSKLATRRLTTATFAAVDFRGRRVIDIGCGDGAFAVELYDAARPAALVGVDPAGEAIQAAIRRAGDRPIEFGVESAYELPFAGGDFDVAHLRGVLHHLDRPVDALREALRVAPEVVVIEPNGYNPVLKLLERYSAYHIRHGEKSYPPSRLDRWARKVGGAVAHRQFVGLVPFFCPDWAARVLHWAEPLVERAAVVRKVGCGVYVFVVRRI